MAGSLSDAGKLQTLIDNITFNNTKQAETSEEVLCLGYRHITFFVDIAAAGVADDTIELQVYLQTEAAELYPAQDYDWFDIVDAPFATWEYDHAQVVNAPRPGSAQLREALSWEVTAPKFRIAIVSTETTVDKTLTLTIKAIGIP